MAQTVMIDGELVSAENAKVSVFDRGFLYGDSVFETLRTYQGRVFALDEHLERLAASAASVKLELPVSLELLGREVTQAVAAGANAESYVRVMATRGQMGWGLAPDEGAAPGLRVVIVRALSPFPGRYYEAGISTVTYRSQRAGDEASVAGAKVGNYLVAVLATDAARAAGAQEALIVSAEGRLLEGATSNLFFVRDGKLYTPGAEAGILEGITRAHLMKVAAQEGFPVGFHCPTPAELLSAEEVMISSSVREVVPVVEVDGQLIGDGQPGKMARRLLAAFRVRCASLVNQS